MGGNKDKEELLVHLNRELLGYLEVRRTVSYSASKRSQIDMNKKIRKLTRWVAWLKEEQTCR